MTEEETTVGLDTEDSPYLEGMDFSTGGEHRGKCQVFLI
eukprot:CAMPEP_0201631458 /NCGR_PEP_ID=MMETSP0493-20130528/5431_1 /ASSEMBLY_ACC=CAM_ASM_000838 /TAXON_ID=420259 /ORGANISM="Thalassiosira gravida, Strain GMp14c1" /LENGTH=38 /DNA_ID= /DNA_START= /DNA_END= /DNA_ORIENTATION=